MMHLFISLVSFSILATVRACEGQCIVDVTNAFVGNYTVPVQHVCAEMAAGIAKMLPSRSTAAASKLVEPLLDAYEHVAYDTMEKGIFPSYFHGKCQVNGIDPDGCPNPDCPVVCGTPGSMIHFYSVLKEIAFNVSSTNLNSLCAPSSNTYKTFEKAVLHEIRSTAPHRRSLRLAPRLAPYVLARSDNDPARTTDLGPRSLQKRRGVPEEQTKAQLKTLCGGMAGNLEKECGGKASLPMCSWEKKMKAFILSFP